MTISPKATFAGPKLWLAAIFAAAFCAAGCHSNSQAANNASTNTSQNEGAGPTSANLVPVSNASAPAYGAAASYDQDNGAAGDDSADESAYGIEPEDTAPDPPPPLPDYSQPECTGDNLVWTPGYWYYASNGYYWVPGAWVQAPYTGALWTPGYWAYTNGRYDFYQGYWGPHIGFYGGVNYGFGYFGVGYQGGYWNGDNFYVNRSINNVNATMVRNVYARNVSVNHRDYVSYNGGRGGIQARPQLAELAALREPHAPPMQPQITIRRAAGQNRAQFATANHGRPSEETLNKPVAATRDVRPAPASNLRNIPAAARPATETRASNARPEPQEVNRPAETQPQPAHTEPGREQRVPNQAAPNRVEPNRTEHAPSHVAPNRAEPNHTAPSRPQTHATQPARVTPVPRSTEPTNRAEPNHAAPANRPERAPSRPAEPANRQPPASHAAPSHAAQPSRPAQQEHKASPQTEHKDEKHPQP